MSQVMTEPLPILYRNEQVKHTFKHNRAYHRHTHSDRFRCAELCGAVVYSIIHCLLMKLSRGIDVFVRERAFSRFHLETQTLNKVVGIAD